MDQPLADLTSRAEHAWFRFGLVAAAVALVGWESDAARLQRLQFELVAAENVVWADSATRAQGRPVCPDLVNLPTNEYVNQCGGREYVHAVRRTLAVRELNTFMQGR
jgi:hypothetical protein